MIVNLSYKVQNREVKSGLLLKMISNKDNASILTVIMYLLLS